MKWIKKHKNLSALMIVVLIFWGRMKIVNHLIYQYMVDFGKEHLPEMEDYVRRNDKNGVIQEIYIDLYSPGRNPIGGFDFGRYINQNPDLPIKISFVEDKQRIIGRLISTDRYFYVK